jgi:hypothetical protein
MSYLKTLTSNDVIVTPFTVNKTFSGLEYSSAFFGLNTTYPLAGGSEGTASAALVFSSIKQLYYSNYISGSNGLISNASTASFNTDGTVTGPAYTTNYINSLPNTTGSLRYYVPNAYIGVVSIPSKYYGNYIQPNSLKINITTLINNTSVKTGNYIDDGEGNIISASIFGGNIIYEDGILIFTGVGDGTGPLFAVNSIEFQSSITLYETQYKCTIRANEYNYSLNPSLLTTYGSGSILASGSATYKDFVTGSDFSPFVTTVGLYNDNQELLAVAKLAQPLLTSQTTDTTILINLDR